MAQRKQNTDQECPWFTKREKKNPKAHQKVFVFPKTFQLSQFSYEGWEAQTSVHSVETRTHSLHPVAGSGTDLIMDMIPGFWAPRQAKRGKSDLLQSCDNLKVTFTTRKETSPQVTDLVLLSLLDIHVIIFPQIF